MIAVELLYSAIGAGVGASGSVFIVFKILMSALKEDINEVKHSADQAHQRLDRHLDTHN
jgi:hypothetical protein